MYVIQVDVFDSHELLVQKLASQDPTQQQPLHNYQFTDEDINAVNLITQNVKMKLKTTDYVKHSKHDLKKSRDAIDNMNDLYKNVVKKHVKIIS